jgi:C1A family cysteine protease
MYNSFAPRENASNQATPEGTDIPDLNKYHSMKWKVMGFIATASVGSLLLFSGHGPAKSSTKVVATSLAKTVVADDNKDKLSTLDSKSKAELFESFKNRFGVEYETAYLESEKYKNFESFLATVDERNEAEKAAGGTAVHGVTRFADMSQEEFKKNFLGFTATDDKSELLKDANSGSTEYQSRISKHTTTVGSGDSTDSSSTTVSWVGVYTTPIKDQGYCGSCWAFSTIQQIESDAIMNNYLTTDDWLSPQQLVSCDSVDAGCDGGVPVYAYQYVRENGGITTNETYPYSSYYAVAGSCKTIPSSELTVTVNSFYFLENEDQMEEYVANIGPLSVCLDATDWASYTGGILSTCSDSPNHCVQIVGINQEENYWLVRNSWGTAWGESGYIRMQTGKDLCGITYIPTYVSTTKV